MQFKVSDYLFSDERFCFTRKTLAPTRHAKPHTHDYHEVFWVKSGVGEHWINGDALSLTAGSLCFIRPTDEHAFICSAESPLVLVNVTLTNQSVFHLGERYASELAGRFFWSDSSLPWHIHLSEEQQRQLTQMEHLLENGTRSLARIEGFILELTAWLGVEDTHLDQAPDWLKQACREALNPEVFQQGVARFVGICGKGHEHVCRATKRHLNQTPAQFLNSIRMNYCARAISNTSDDFESISRQCGIDNLSHFYRQFKKHTGMTPGQYRASFRRDPIQPG